MLTVATVVFAYYTIWTLMMVCASFCSLLISRKHAKDVVAIRRRRSSSPSALPTTRLGYPHPSHPHPAGLSSRRLVLVRGHDQEQQKEGAQSEAGEESLIWLPKRGAGLHYFQIGVGMATGIVCVPAVAKLCRCYHINGNCITSYTWSSYLRRN